MASTQDRRELRRRLLQVAGGHSGMFTAAQAKQAGYSYAAQRYHVEHGNWNRIDRGLFRLPDWPTGPHEDLVRWVLWSGGRAVVSYETALSVHGLGDVDPARVHLTVPPSFRMSSPGAVFHKQELPHSDIQHLEGFPVTTPIRTVLDVAAGQLDQDQLTRAVHQALDDGLVTKRRLLERADAFGAHAALRIERALAAGGR